MTLGLGRFRDVVANAQSGDYIVHGPTGGLNIVTSQVWNSQRGEWKEAKQAFLECLKKELDPLLYESLLYLPSLNGKPLDVCDVRLVLTHLDALISQQPKPAKPGALISQQLKPAKPAVRDMSNVFVDPYEVTLSKSPPSAQCAADEIPQLDIDKFDREFGELQRQLGEWPSSFTSGQKQVVQSYALMSPAIPIDEMVHVGQLLTVRPGSAMVADIETITINSSALESPAELPPPTASRSWGGAHRRPQIKGPKGKEHEDVPPPKLAKSDHAAAQRIQDKAWRDLNPQFETLLDNVAILTNEAAKAGVGGGKKKAPSEARGTHAETFCAQMFAGPLPDLDAIGTLIGSLGHKTKNPLSVYFKLPNAMQDWLFRMRNAEIKLDVDQVTREIAATFKDLKSDAENIDEILEDRANNQLNRNQREVLEGISNRLNLMLTQYTEKNSEPLIYLGTPLKDLIDRCDKLKAVLPDSLPEINPKHHYLAYYALTKQMGIDADPYTDTATLVRTANRMLKAYHLMRSRLAEGDPWETIFDEASPSDKQLLVEYREARLNGIRREVRNATGVTMEFIDGEDEEKIFYFDSRNEQAIRHANHALRTMAFAMGGTYRLLYDVFGCQERSLEEIEQEREKAEQALGQAQPATA